MLLKMDHWYELGSGIVSRARPSRSDPDYPFQVGGYRQTPNGHYYTDGRIHTHNVRQEVLVTPVPLLWWEREGIKVGDWVMGHSGRIYKINDLSGSLHARCGLGGSAGAGSSARSQSQRRNGMQIKEGHYYELNDGEIGTAERTGDHVAPWQICGHTLTDGGYYWADGRAEVGYVVKEVLVTDAPIPWWEREGIEVGDYVLAFGFRLRQVTGFYEQGVLLEFADSKGIRLTRSNTWALSEQDFQGKVTITKEKRNDDSNA